MVDGKIKGKTAEQMAKEHKEISISEFFEKNRHLLGYDNPTRALITIVKEMVDNSLDACEEGRILPRIWLEVKPTTSERFRVMCKDNGPGIIDKQIPKTMAKLLVGSKFYKLIQSRGQQGLGIKGAVLYAQLTSGKPTTFVSSTGKGKTSFYELMVDVKKNEPKIISHQYINDGREWHGLKVDMEFEGRYVESKSGVTEFIKQVAIANPFAEIIFEGPNGRIEFRRGAMELPPLPREIKPHPYGVELGIFRRMIQGTTSRTVKSFLMNDFTRVGSTSAEETCKLAGIDPKVSPKSIDMDNSEKIFKAMKKIKLLRPPTDCLSPLGEDLMLAGLKKEIKAEFFSSVTRPPAVYRGNPFQVEVGIAYGGELPIEGGVDIIRLSNRVPLMYQAGDCAITKAITGTDWKKYGFNQSGKNLPTGPGIVMVHFASTWVPYTSESKQAVASYPVIIKEIKLALQEAGRRMQRYVSGKRRFEMHQHRKKIFERYIPEVAEALNKLTKKDKELLKAKLQKMAKEVTEVKSFEQESEADNV
ncbi:MAG: DNA topoisomerase VI subunit B [Candidatus Aenigmarchaeota archaeon]|nr:DNA topoisomerase VI subunit B [Candidatus Aenigmarchaeota archaeon]